MIASVRASALAIGCREASFNYMAPRRFGYRFKPTFWCLLKPHGLCVLPSFQADSPQEPQQGAPLTGSFSLRLPQLLHGELATTLHLSVSRGGSMPA